MKHASWLVLAACSGDEPLAELERRIEVDVVVEDNRVTAFVAGDLTCECQSNHRRFPQVGECLSYSDSVSCSCTSPAKQGTCLDELSVDGVTAQLNPVAFPYGWPLALSDQSVLVVRGCGHDLEVPLRARTLPNATTQVMTDGTLHTIAWTADATTQTALVQMNTSLFAEHCHDLGASGQRTFDVRFEGGFPPQLHVQPFLPVDRVTGTFGEVRIWHGRIH